MISPPPPASPPGAGNATGSLPPPPRSDATIIASRVSKAFGSLVAVSEVSFVMAPGVTALLGPNGAGKSTLLRLICGLTIPTTGTVSVMGGNPRDSAAARKAIGLVPQQDGVFERESVRDFVRLAAVLSEVDDVEGSTEAALVAVELEGPLDRPIGSFSKGMRQRAKIASAIVHDPAVLVLDEPLNGLDPRQRRSMIDLFHRLGAEGKTVVVSSHVLDEVERFGSNVLVIARGRLAAQGDYRAIRELMNDQPLRFRVDCEKPHLVSARLIADGIVSGLSVDAAGFEATTTSAPRFRRAITAVCRDHNARLYQLDPLDDDLESVFRYLVA